MPVDQLGRKGMRAPVRQAAPARAATPAATRKATPRTPGATAPASSPQSFRTPTGKIKLFGTVEFKRPLSTLPGWLDVINRNSSDPIFILQKHFNKSTTWQKMKDDLDALSPLDKLRRVNAFWNGWPYREDIENWGQEDYWASPAQFLKKSGDCEDYAIVKYFTLKELGFDPQKMRIVVLRDTVRNLAHAVLAVYQDDEAYILDNLSNAMLPHSRLGNYSPQYSVNEHGRWAHIKSKK